MDTEIARKHTASALINAHDAIKERLDAMAKMADEITAVLESCKNAEDRVVWFHHYPSSSDIVRGAQCLKASFWDAIANRMGFKQMMSSARYQEWKDLINSELQTTYRRDEKSKLPDVSAECVAAFMQSLAENASTYIDECIKEAFEILRPRERQWHTAKKTNAKFQQHLADKAVLYGWSDCGRRAMQFSISHYRDKDACIVDQAFHLLDGKTLADAYRTPLAEALRIDEGQDRETEYFRFRFFKNGNAHIWFKRHDLVAKMNRQCAGRILSSE